MIDLGSLSRYGSIGAYTKKVQMQQKWERKQSSGNILSKSSTTATQPKKEYKTAAAQAMEEKRQSDQVAMDIYAEQQENKDQKMEYITNKVMYGHTLTEDEMEYLREKNPQLYEELRREESEAKVVEEKLKHAKTKEEAQQIMTDETNKALSVAKSTSSNPHISAADKAAIMAKELRTLKHAQSSFKKFQDSGAYSKLPTETEKDIAERDEKDAKEHDMEKAVKSLTEKMEEYAAKNGIERSDKTAAEENEATAAANFEGSADPSDPEKEGVSHESMFKPESRKNMTSEEAQNTYEAQKLKRSKHKGGSADITPKKTTGSEPVIQPLGSGNVGGGIRGMYGLGSGTGAGQTTGGTGNGTRSLDVHA